MAVVLEHLFQTFKRNSSRRFSYDYSKLPLSLNEGWTGSFLLKFLFLKLCLIPRWTHSVGLTWQGFGSGGREVAGVVSARRIQGLPPCLTEPLPAGSKTDPPLPSAEPTCNAGGASMKTYLRKGKALHRKKGMN